MVGCSVPQREQRGNTSVIGWWRGYYAAIPVDVANSR
jgi:hypothetical protein